MSGDIVWQQGARQTQTRNEDLTMAHTHNMIRFLLNDEIVGLERLLPDLTLLDYLRLEKRLRGTKEGCAEGDCGACTVLVGRLRHGQLIYETVNACIRFVGSLQGCHVVTIEHLAARDGTLHPVQQAMVDCHGSQCGFCTPGIVMSLYALWMMNGNPDPAAIEKALQGNLCRCTGYEPIVQAARAAASVTPDIGNDRLLAERTTIIDTLQGLADDADIEICAETEQVIVPANVDSLAEIYEIVPHATIVAGSTDVGLWVTKQMRDISPVIFIDHLDELKRIDERDDGVTFAAGVSYTDAFPVISRRYPALTAYWERIGGEQVRNMGTLGGNIANGSPIGDTPPPMIVLGATLVLRKGSERRRLALEEFFLAYGKQDRHPGEFIEAIEIPALPESEHFAVYKISKRRDEDISTLAGAFRLTLDDAGTVTSARIAFGGMAATPKRARAVEAALIGKAWTQATVETARAAFAHDYQPLSDWRASADYRMRTARNLLTRFFLETTGATGSPMDRKPVQLIRHATSALEGA